MDNRNWYGQSDWYDCYKYEEIDKTDVSVVPPKEKKFKWWRPVGIIILCIAVIAASSIAFSGAGKTAIWFDFGTDDFGKLIPGNDDYDRESMPDSAEDFFDSYYQDVEDSNVQVNIPETETRETFRLSLESTRGELLSLGELYEQCACSIVAIYGYVDGQEGYYWGTGIVLSEDGLILTNTHIVDGCDKATVKLSDNSEFEARLVGADGISDIAVLKIDGAVLKPAQFGNSSLVNVGDEVAAIGNPLGEQFRLTMTNGIISAIDRGIDFKGRSMTLMQTNTAINSGNSGGALFNMYGQVIGVTNMKMMSSYDSIEGIGFAIPTATVREVVNSLIANGKVVGRPSIGIVVGAIPDYAKEKYGMPEGVYVSEVKENSDAARKGVQKGDIITEVNYIPVTSPDEINNIKNTLEVDDIMIFSIWRDGETLEIEVTLMDTNDVY